MTERNTPPLRRLIDLPGVRDLENYLVLNLRWSDADDIRERTEQLSRDLFGISLEEAMPAEPLADEDEDPAAGEARNWAAGHVRNSQ